MSDTLNLELIGGNGGGEFSFTGEDNGASLEKIGVWLGEWQVKAVRVWLSDGRVETFGEECFTSLSLWGNGAGTRLGAIKFKTSLRRKFFAKMTSWGLKTEYPMDVGSGYCLGVVLPYTGTVKMTCKNGSVFAYGTKGTYKGVTYTDIKVDTKESPL
ncbi:hypothetical protein PO909_024921 [Leuciscus waleckii]